MTITIQDIEKALDGQTIRKAQWSPDDKFVTLALENGANVTFRAVVDGISEEGYINFEQASQAQYKVSILGSSNGGQRLALGLDRLGCTETLLISQLLELAKDAILVYINEELDEAIRAQEATILQDPYFAIRDEDFFWSHMRHNYFKTKLPFAITVDHQHSSEN